MKGLSEKRCNDPDWYALCVEFLDRVLLPISASMALMDSILTAKRWNVEHAKLDSSIRAIVLSQNKRKSLPSDVRIHSRWIRIKLGANERDIYDEHKRACLFFFSTSTEDRRKLTLVRSHDGWVTRDSMDIH